MTQLEDIKRSIEQMPIDEITPIVRSAVGDDSAVIQPGWTVEPMSAISVGSGTLGFLRVEGDLGKSSDKKSWSIIVKVLSLGITSNNIRFANSTRELEALRSGLLGDVESGLRSIPIYGITDRPDDTVWVWMQDLTDAEQPPWKVDSFLLAARHIGMFNGSFPESNGSPMDWVATDGSTDRRPAIIRHQGAAFEALPQHTNHPGFVRAASHIGVDRMLALRGDSITLLEATSSLARTVAHNDLHTRNLFPWDEDSTIAIDWASTGFTQTGVDGGSLAGGGITWAQAESDVISQIEPQIFSEYLAGLRSAGYNDDESSIRLVYLSTFTNYVALLPHIMNTFITEEPNLNQVRRRMSVTGEEVYDQIAERLATFIPLVDEGLALAR